MRWETEISVEVFRSQDVHGVARISRMYRESKTIWGQEYMGGGVGVWGVKCINLVFVLLEGCT